MIPKWAENQAPRAPLFTAEQIAAVRAITQPPPVQKIEVAPVRKIIKIKRKKHGE